MIKENLKIGLVGSSSTGKSTVFSLFPQFPYFEDFDFISESTRTVREFGFPINEQGTGETQLAISTFHLRALLSKKPTILDRCYLDLLVYTDILQEDGLVSEHVYKYVVDTWEEVMYEYNLFIYFPIEFPAVKDGVRSVDEGWRRRVDEKFKYYFNLYKLSPLVVTGSPKNRIKQIQNYLEEQK